MTAHTLAMVATGVVHLTLLYCWFRYVLHYRPRGRHPVRRHPGARPSNLDKWLRIR